MGCPLLGQTLCRIWRQKWHGPYRYAQRTPSSYYQLQTLQNTHYVPGTALSTSSTVCVCVCVCVCVWWWWCYRLVATSCLFCDPMDYSPPGSSIHGISQGRIREWVASSFSRGSSQPRGWTCIFCLPGGFFITEPATWEARVCRYTVLILTTTL